MSSSRPLTNPELTPPASFDGSGTPPIDGVPDALTHTPPSNHRIKATASERIIAALRRGHYPDQLVYRLIEGEFAEIRRYLEENGDQIRYDYDAQKNRFAIHLPDPKHDIFTDLVRDEISTQLKRIATGSDPAARFAQGIASGGTATNEYPLLEDPSKESVHSPDAQFHYNDTGYPAVVIEVAHSQRWKDFRKLAGSYIMDSKGLVRVVVGLDLSYGPQATSKATVSVWRLHTDHVNKMQEPMAHPDQEVFRDESGRPTKSNGLQLRLSDFAPKKLSRDLDTKDDRDIIISGDRLYQLLTDAENRSSALKRRRSEDVDWEMGYKKSKGSSSPPRSNRFRG